MKIELKHIAAYLPYDFQVYVDRLQKSLTIITLNKSKNLVQVIYDDRSEGQTVLGLKLEHVKPILRPLSDLLEKLDFFEIGDDSNYSIEFDHGNIKLIENLESIADNKSYFDIQFLPYAVVQQLIEWHLDIFGLIPAGLAISIHDVEQVIA